MKVNPETYEELTYPAYVLEEKRLRRNLALIRDVAERSGTVSRVVVNGHSVYEDDFADAVLESIKERGQIVTELAHAK